MLAQRGQKGQTGQKGQKSTSDACPFCLSCPFCHFVLAGMFGLLAACAAVQEPPGGPPDFTPPAIDSTIPDSGAVVPGWHDPAVIRFNEVVDERSGGSLDKLITLSPVPEELGVSWKRTAIEVRPKGGWRQGAVYQLTLLPGIQDLRNNRLTEGKTVIFSTGGAIPATRISGTVLDWEQGRVAGRALVEAVEIPDSLRYLEFADSVGEFVMGSLPVGRYLLMAGVDANNNRRLDVREPFDSLTVRLDSVLSHTFWAFKQDTVGPGLSRVTLVDSVTLRLEFSQALPPALFQPGRAQEPPTGSVTVLGLPDSTPVAVAAVMRQADYDSLTAAERARPAAARDTTATDTTRAAQPPAAADTTRRPLAPARPRSPSLAPGQPADTTGGRRAAADTSRAGRLLRERPKLSNVLMVRLEQPVTPGTRYLVLTDLPSMLGIRGAGRQVLAVPARTP